MMMDIQQTSGVLCFESTEMVPDMQRSEDV